MNVDISQVFKFLGKVTCACKYLYAVSHKTSEFKSCYSLICVCVLSPVGHVWLFETLWTVAHQAPLSMGFSRQEYWSGLPCLSPGDSLDPGIKFVSHESPALAARFLTTSTMWEAHSLIYFPKKVFIDYVLLILL